MRSVMITGASRGIGLEFVRAHAADGYQVYATCHKLSHADRLKALQASGPGKIDIIEQADANTYKEFAKIDTANGARTGLFVPERDSLFVAVPRHGSQAAEIRCYQIK